jgi:hypothetical protein
MSERAAEQIRETEKAYWQAWAMKRLDIQAKFWVRAAKSALAGDMRELRNRVELHEAEPVEVVLSDLPSPPTPGKQSGEG